jgi:hypothetical protein
MGTAQLLFRKAALWLVRSRNPQVETYFRSSRVVDPKPGRPSNDGRESRLKPQHP